MRIWIITDTHFNHSTLIEMKNRPKNFEDKLYTNLYKSIEKDDILIHLGDFCIGNDEAEHSKFCLQLNCKKWFVVGNHDSKSKNWYLEHGWDWCGDSFIWDLYGKKILFSHIPQKKSAMFDINIHGHFHDFSDETIAFHEPAIFKIIDPTVHYLVSMEQTKYQPIQLKTIIDKFKLIESN